MPLGEVYKPYTDMYNAVIADEPPAKEASVGDVFGAAARLENDVVAAWNIMHKPVFQRDPKFNAFEKTKGSKYWQDHSNVFIGTVSEDDWNYRAAKLEKELADRELLASQGWAGLGAAMAMGVLSPTMLVPLATPYKGLRGFLAAGALGGIASIAQEVPLQIDQLARTTEESAIAVAAGAITGGVLGGAAQYLKRGEQHLLTEGVARAHGDPATPVPTITKAQVAEARAATAEIVELGTRSSKTISRIESNAILTGKEVDQLTQDAKPIQTFVQDRFGPYVDVAPVDTASRKIGRWTLDVAPDAPVVRLPVREIIHVTEDGDFITANAKQSPFYLEKGGKLANPDAVLKIERPKSASPLTEGEVSPELYPTSAGAAADPQLPQAQGLKAQSRLEQWAINKLAKLSPVAATIAQEEFKQFQRGMAAISTGGLKLAGNVKGWVSSVGGTVEARRSLYDTFVAKTVKVVDQHYADYFYEGAVAPAFPETAANIRSTFRFTGEKMDRKGFNIEISRALIEGNHPIKQVKQAADILRSEVLNPIKEQMESVSLIPKEVDLGEDEFWLARIYDTQKIDADPNGFVDTIADYYKNWLLERFTQGADRLKEQEKFLEEYVDDVLASYVEVGKRRQELLEQLHGKPAVVKMRHRVARDYLDHIGAEEFPGFEKNFQSEMRYSGNELGDDGIYIDNSGVWSKGDVGAFGTNKDLIYEVDVDITDALVITPENFKKFFKESGVKGDTLEDIKYAGERFAKWVKDKGYTGLVFEGFEKFTDEIPNKFHVGKWRDVEGFAGTTYKEIAFDDLEPAAQKHFLKVRKLEVDYMEPRDPDAILRGDVSADEYMEYLIGKPPEGFSLDQTIMFDVDKVKLGKKLGQGNMRDYDGVDATAAQRAAAGLEETDEEVAIAALKEERRQLNKQEITARGVDAVRQKDAIRLRKEEIAAEIKRLSETAAPTIAKRRELRRRLRNLDRSYWAMEEKQARTLQRIDTVEEAALTSLRGLIKKGKRLQRDLDKISEKELRARLNKLVAQHNKFQLAWVKREERLQKLVEAGDPDKVMQYIDRIGKTHFAGIERMGKIMERFDNVEDLLDSRELLAEWLEEIADESAKKVNALNLNRGKRIAKLAAKAEKQDPKIALRKVEEAKTRQALRRMKFNDQMRELGIDDFDWETGEAVVDQAAQQKAEETKSLIQGLNRRIAGLHIIGEERASELARTLKIGSMHPSPKGGTLFDNYLENDIERVVRNYIRQVGADIELKRTFGDVNLKGFFQAAEEEYNQVIRKMEADGATADEIGAATKRYRKLVANMNATVARLRHLWGIPDDPQGFAARAAKVMLDLNTLRMMGSVAISSIPDLARPVMKYGISRTFKSAFLPLIADFKNWKLSARELKLAGGALDPIIHSRALAYADIMDEIANESMPERVLHTTASKIGKIAGFDYWTSFMKQVAGTVQVAELTDSIMMVAGREAGDEKEMAKAIEYLASVGIDSRMAMSMAGEIEAGGGGKVRGIWLPQTENWADGSLVRSFRAALRQENEATIITPGLELPLWLNSGLGTRLLFQFKSFSFASHTKTLMAGLQERDMRVLNGAVMGVALGMLSYYLRSMSIGGVAQENMENASFEKWVDEGYAAAGFMGPFYELQRIAERIPAVAEYANLSGERTTNRAGSSLVESLLGPSFDLAQTGSNVLLGLDDPTKATVGQFFNLLPFQNVFYLRRLFDMVEDAASANLPERRG